MHVIKLHLITHGFLSTYTRWYHHGEQVEEVEDEGLFETKDTVEDSDQRDDLATGLHDAIGSKYFDIGPTSDFNDESPLNVDDKYDALFESLHKPLYNNCKGFSVLSAIVKLMNLKVLNKWTDKSFDGLLECLTEILPEGNQCPGNYYQTSKLLCEVGLGYEQIDVCQYDCALFYGENANAVSCPVCKSSRYVQNQIPHKRLRWFPIKAQLKRLFSSKHTSKDMQWHKEVRKNEARILRHPADGDAWKHFDNVHPDFAADSRSVRTGLASDGFNPFSNMTSTYSLWPVILIPYNMPPWASPNGINYLMSLLIPGPKSPGKYYDVFLKPLIEELKEAAVLWTISDFPAYAYLSGWSTAGKLACLVCLEDTRSRRITDKQCFMGHRCYLKRNHSWRKSKEYDGSTELRGPPRNFTSDDILKQLDEIPIHTPGNAPSNSSRKRKCGEKEMNWCNRSVLFDLPYWSKLLLRHNLDVMHIEKNVCDNIIGTLLDIEGKSKDNLKARKDFQNLNICEELWLKKDPSNNKLEKPYASYTLTREECKDFCKFIQSVRLPDGYASNISRCVKDNDKLGGMKTHDCHVLLHKILPVALLPFLTDNIRGTLIELCQFFQKICAKTFHISDIEELRDGIVIILCKLEKIFPPSFFTIMVHLSVHLPDQVLLGGLVASRWMFGIECHMGLYKKYVRNMSRPDGSIAEAFVVDEAITFLSRYVSNIETRFTRPERNWDIPSPNHNLDVFNSNVRPLGASTVKLLQNWRKVAQWYILNNFVDDIQDFLDDHIKLLEEKGLSDSEVALEHKEQFPSWFKNKVSQMRVQKSPLANYDLYSLSQVPLERYNTYQSCIVNGVQFRCKERDDTLKTQCSGICTEGDHDNISILYYGVLIEIFQLSFILDRKVFLFRCKWYNSNPKGRSIVVDHNLTSINTSTDWYSNEPFILATQAQQVFYLLDMKHGSNWRIVQKVNHQSIYDIPEIMEETVNNDVFQEEESFQLPPFQPTEDFIESSSLVRLDVPFVTLLDQLVVDLFSNQNQNVDKDSDLDEDFDEGNIFCNNETFLSSDDTKSSTESECDDDADS
ncbi:uncharacterized protein LOC133792082 [Humulus lupulus]|uniref:uncharacterized protein LOC133792082 n=1 Tax=Humulus lupulus TaxID=3486 RepID=UPI002B412BAD|nr:uncharacterized protein LOC133792082 [Humulus lupulus]